MAAYRRVYDSHHLAAGWLPRTGISSGTLRSVIEYVLPLLFKVMPFVTYVGTLAAPSGPQPSARRIWIVSTQRTIEVNETSVVGRLSEQEEIYRLWPHAASPVPSDRSADNETVDEIRSMQYNTDECGSRKASKISGRVWCCILSGWICGAGFGSFIKETEAKKWGCSSSGNTN